MAGSRGSTDSFVRLDRDNRRWAQPAWMMAVFHAHASRAAAARALADTVLARLREGLQAGGHATLVVPGGTSPMACFDHLRGVALGWSRITILPSDQRWLATDHDDRNEHMLRNALLRHRVAAARFAGLYRDTPSPGEARDDIAAALAGLPDVFDAVVLGVGTDGHITSLFPDAANIAACLAAETPCVAPERPAGDTPRLSLGRLLAAREIDLLFFGEAKRTVFEAECMPGSVAEYPVRGVIHQTETPVHVYWPE